MFTNRRPSDDRAVVLAFDPFAAFHARGRPRHKAVRTDLQPHEDWRRHQDRRIGADEHAEQDRGGKAENHVGTENQQHAEREQHRDAGHHGARQRFVDAEVEQRNDVYLAVFLQIFANAVIHDDRIVQRIADDRQQRRDAVQVELQLRHRKEAEGQRDLVEQAAERADAELPFEADPDIDRDAEHREREADRAGAQQFLGYLARHGFDRSGLRGRKRILDARDQLLPRALGGGLVAVGKRGADRNRIARTELLDRRFAEADVADLFADFVDRRHILREFDADRLAADEIDAEVQSLHRDERDRDDDQDDAHGGSDLAPPQEVDVRVVGDEFEQTHRSLPPLNIDRRRTLGPQPMGDEHARDGHGG